MGDMDKILKELQPYVAGVRYVDGIPVVDAYLKKGWKVPKSKIVSFEIGKNKRYFMFYSDKEDIGFNEIIDYIKIIIKLNIER